MTFMVERLVELRRHLDHLRRLRPNVTGPDVLREDLSLHNDVFHSLLTICQLVIDIAGELSATAGRRFESYTEAVRNLRHDRRFSKQEAFSPPTDVSSRAKSRDPLPQHLTRAR